MMKETEMKRVPKLRFPEFTDDWEQRKVPELLKNSSSAMKIGPFGSALKKEYFVKEGVKVYAQENAFTGDFSIGDYYITEEKYKELQSCELYPGDRVISMMGTIGSCAIFPETAEKGIMNSHLLRLQFSNEVVPQYIMYLLRDSDLIKKQIDRLSVGSIMSGLSSNVVKKLVFPIPKLPEQKKIVEYLDNLDHLITLHQRKLEKLKKLKKGLVQKLFSQEARFKADDGSEFPEWEEKKLGEFGTFIKGAALSKADISEYGSPFILYGELYTTYKEVAYNIQRRTQAIVDKKYYSCIGDVVIPTSGESAEEISTATCVMVPNVILGGDLNIFRSDIVDGRIMSYILNHQVKWKIAMIAQGKSIVHIQAKQLSNIYVKYPVSKVEQQKIADCLSLLDDVIEKQKVTLAAWEEMKKGLLQQMFV